MKNRIEAAVIAAKCPKYKRMYGIRTQRMADGDWWRTWAFPIDEKRAHNEGYDATSVRGNMYYAEGYPGCPYCGSMSFVQCNKCHKLTCWNGETRLTCEWCGNDMDNITAATAEFVIKGGGDI